MAIAIFKQTISSGWAPAGPEYTFNQAHEDDQPYCEFEAPAGWFLVGEPEPLLVRRTSNSEFTSRTATECLFAALANLEGFRMVVKPTEGTAGDWNREIVRTSPTASLKAQIVQHNEGQGALPAPSTNGKLPATRGGKRGGR